MSEEAMHGGPPKAIPTVEEISLEDLEIMVVAAGAPKGTATFMKSGWTKHLPADRRSMEDILGAASLEGNLSAK